MPSSDYGKLGALGELTGLQLRLAQLKFFSAYFREFGETGISPAENAVLALLAETPGLRQGELGDMLHIKRSNMTKIMRGLEQRGLIWRVAPQSDARAFEVRLTDEGYRVHKALADKVLDNDRRCASALTVAEQAELMRLLRKLNAGAEATNARPNREEVRLNG